MLTFSNAKINLGLRVLGKRTDGYHELQSLFIPVPIHDALELADGERPGLELLTYGLSLPKGPNICDQVYELLSEQFDLPPLRLHLLKGVPIGAGLGGGSSNAACLLKMLNENLGLGLCQTDLHGYAEQLGSDVPFFLNNTTCMVNGRGEVMKPFDLDLSGLWVQVVHPGLHCSTAKIFSAYQPHGKSIDLELALMGDRRDWSKTVFNELEPAAFALYPAIRALKEELYQAGAVYAAMSGSGSSVFGLYNAQPSAHRRFRSWSFQL